MSEAEGAAASLRAARPFELGKVLRAYRECFDEIQRRRTVAASPLLFRLYYGSLLMRGKSEIQIAVADRKVAGFVIVRSQGRFADRWLLSAIGVVPQARGRGLAKRLFESVGSRRLTLTVEEGGPLAFYEGLGLRRAGARTLIYFSKAEVDALRGLPIYAGPASAPFSIRTVNRHAFLVHARKLSDGAIAAARRRFRFARLGILEVPERIEAPSARFTHIVHEVEFETP